MNSPKIDLTEPKFVYKPHTYDIINYSTHNNNNNNNNNILLHPGIPQSQEHGANISNNQRRSVVYPTLEENLSSRGKVKNNNNNNTNKNSICNDKTSTINNSWYSEDFNWRLDHIKWNYAAALITRLMKRLLKLKQSAHQRIVTEKYIDIDSSVPNNSNPQTNVNWFPEWEYKYIGSKFGRLKDGFGMQLFEQSRSKFFGIFINNLRKGICKYENKSDNYEYHGYVDKNFASGFGWYIHHESPVHYIGGWHDNKKHGIGLETFKDNSTYSGEYQYGRKHGIGSYKWIDGSHYEGEWKNNAWDGYGTYVFQDKSYYSGEWKKNKIDGFGEFSYPGQKTYIGYFTEEKKNGFGILYWYDKGKGFVGFWSENKQHGYGKFLAQGGKVKYGRWMNGVRKEVFKSNEEFDIEIRRKPEMKYKFFFNLE